MVSVGEELYGKYRVVAALTPGSFGKVFRVYNFGLGRSSVIKTVPVADPAYFKELIEAYSLNLSKHPHVVEIYACETNLVEDYTGSLVPGIVMEMEDIPGGNFQQQISAGYVPLSRSIRMMTDVLYATQHAHSQNIIHGDIKPDNIFIARDGDKLADFGLAKNMNIAGINRAQDRFYRPNGAPELFSGVDIDSSTDIFAAGMTLFRAVNNVKDWRSTILGLGNHKDLMERGFVIKKLGYAPEVPKAIQRIINRACNPQPASRYPNCAKFREAITSLRFRTNWRKENADQWISELPSRTERLEIVCRPRSFSVEYKLNGRRQNKHCSQFALRSEADKFAHQTIADTTLE